MNKYVEHLKAKNPMINRVLCEQEKCKWEITQDARFKTVSDTSAYEMSCEKFTNLKNNIICPHGVKF